LTIEELLLLLEAAFSRKEFKHQILQTIEEERIEFEKFLCTLSYPDNNLEISAD
jgi:hypothetical protein